ncbi:carbohydrate ABC transporter ATP-binding protein, CUT1 family [Ruminococcus sp. YE71]|uniref:ABC transporter ATP-binding protein n=1 Tax=unclassified Ruminococcus TaxID=2608920 RepID=UPI00088F358D|nr:MULTISPECIES: sn-glycerol-3-phosphate ABC transporter ATP-binding protein UgpC [unclassified Ruminococcus]SDA12117.1 carbohydrate ABC transporter ATP-binding protein, CUT1 family [Ruminococcus sp. YE78]SFW16302.1 carbohydrate ABC transporter ATP-binding protein, CUT1 family [Ruminococcus sp. YE71]
MADVKLTNVKKQYDNGFVAVHDFNLEIKHEEFIVLVGPSGCGKSTTLRMIAGLEDITDGTIEIDGTVVNDMEPKDRDIAMVFQNYALYPHMSVYENIAFGLRLRKVPNKEIHKKVTEAAEILGITELLGRKPKQLSGGQRQRVAIGRAIVRVPKVFLMDEPLSNLDAKLRNQMRAEIILLREKIRTTFVYVTHDQTEAMTLGDRIVIMKDGYVMQVGTPQELFNHPANLFVAGFIGTPQMNFFDAELKKDRNGYTAKVEGLNVKVPKHIADALDKRESVPEKVLLGVRPENLILTDSGESIGASIKVTEMMGSEIHIHAELPDGKNVIIKVQIADLDDDQQNEMLTRHGIAFRIRERTINLFDPEDGRNLAVSDAAAVPTNE